MAQRKVTAVGLDWKALVSEDQDMMRVLVQEVVQQVLEAEMEEALQAGKGERTECRLGYRSGYYPRTLVTRVGRLELRVPQDRQGRFSTEVFERYQRSEKALVLALAQMYVQGVSTRKVKAITEELCGHAFSASAVSDITRCLDEQLNEFASRSLESEEYPYLILDARYERVREGGVIRHRAVQIAIGINWDGRRCVLGVELANQDRFLPSVKRKPTTLSLRPRADQGCSVLGAGFAPAATHSRPGCSLQPSGSEVRPDMRTHFSLPEAVRPLKFLRWMGARGLRLPAAAAPSPTHGRMAVPEESSRWGISPCGLQP